MRPKILLLVACLAFLGAACLPPAPQPSSWPAPGDEAAIHVHPFFVCTLMHESDRGDANGNGLHNAGYQAVSPGGVYTGAYQFDGRTWQGAVTRAVGGAYAIYALWPARDAPVAVQDVAAHQLANERGAQPWGNRCREHLYR